MKDFVHLHLHTEYSLLDGFARIKKDKTSPLAEAVKAKGMKAVAITDHGNMYGVYPFVEMLQKNKIKPIIGSEFYTCEDITVRNPREDFHHLILLAKTQQGYKNLMRLSSISFVDGFYSKPRIDLKLIEKYSEGLICLSACVQGAIPMLLIAGDYDGAKAYALNFKRIFGEDFYLEVQYHGLEKQKLINPLLIKLGQETGIELVATNDVHYLTKEDAEVQDVLMCISMQRVLSDPNRIKLDPQEFYLKDYDEMAKMLPPEIYGRALDNTVVIADKCNVEVMINAPAGKYEIPEFKPDNGQKPEDYLKDMSYENLPKRYKEITPEISERLKMELSIITKMGFAGYYLIVWDFIRYAKSQGIPVGPGRGSGVGSIVAYLLGITDVEPLRYNLLFERFLNPERISMPDFDIDFCIEGRAKVIEYVSQKYGKENVTQIISYGTLAARAAVKDVARAYEVNYNDADKWAKAIPMEAGKASIEKCLGQTVDKDSGRPIAGSPDFINFYENDVVAHSVIDMAKKLEGMPRQTGMHAAGVLICPGAVYNYLPLQKKDGSVTTQFDKDQVEHMGLVKMDFLGLRTLTDIRLALSYIKKDFGKDIDLENLSTDDPEVYREISSGDTEAIFQVEKAGIRKFMAMLAPDKFEEIIAGVALYRPGPMQFTGAYIKGKKNPESVRYADKALIPILGETYGCIVYQEQVMQLARELAGYTYGGADELRRAMSKKKKDVMTEHRKIFVYGRPASGSKPAIDGTYKRGIPTDVAEKLFDDITIFAEYAFNKSHAAAYSVLTYQTAFLKKYYRVQFLTAVLNNRISDAKEISKYVNYLNSVGVKLYPPNINKSSVMFSTEEKGVRFGLMAIKNVGEAVVTQIVEERTANGEYADLEDLIKRNDSVNLNKRLLENMIKGGVFDCFGKTRSTLLASYEIILATINNDKKHRATGQMSLFDVFEEETQARFNYPDIREFDETEKLIMEKEVLGMYATGHPLNSYRNTLNSFGFNTLMLLAKDEEIDLDDETVIIESEEDEDSGRMNYDKSLNNTYVIMGGVISGFEQKVAKNSGKNMGYGTLEDLTGTIEIVCFPDAFEKYRSLLFENSFVKVEGMLDIPDGDKPKIKIKKVEVLQKPDDNGKTVEDKRILYLNLAQNESIVKEVVSILELHAGKNEVIAKLNGQAHSFRQTVNIDDGLLLDLEVLLGDKNILVK